MKEKEEIGKRISIARKSKKMTQQELAEKLFVSDKAISNWETGKNLPEEEILRKIENILDVKILEKRYNKKRVVKRICLISLFVLLLLVLCPLTIYFVNNYNKVKMYEVTLNSNTFTLEYGDITFIQNTILINFGKIINKELPYQPKYQATLYYQEKNTKKEIVIKDNYNTLYLKEEKENYTLLNEEFIKNIDSLYLNIKYRSYENEEMEEDIKLNIKEIKGNNKLFYKEANQLEKIDTTLSNLLKNNQYHRVSNNLYEKMEGNNYYAYDTLTNIFSYYGIDNDIEYFAIKEKDKTYKYAIVSEENIVEYKLINGNKGKKYVEKIEEKLNELMKIEF